MARERRDGRGRAGMAEWQRGGSERACGVEGDGKPRALGQTRRAVPLRISTPDRIPRASVLLGSNGGGGWRTAKTQTSGAGEGAIAGYF
jgi:hypothetical protein